VKTVVEYRLNEKGQKVRVVRRFRTQKLQTRTPKSVEARRRWRKFGDCAGLPPGPEKVITSLSEELFLELKGAAKGPAATGLADHALGAAHTAAADAKRPAADAGGLDKIPGIVCRNCGKVGEHWTLKCPFARGAALNAENSAAEQREREQRAATAAGDKAGADKGGVRAYQPPGAREGGSRWGPSAGGGFGDGRRDETATIRVTNLSEDTTEADLSELFRPFGAISRIYLAKDKHTLLSKGFAFVNFMRREDAARAIEKLSGFGYDHLILHLEWAKPSGDRP
jgi:translation initiation factor 3 subunit G